MNLKLKVTARTPNSEQVAIFDADTKDANDKAVNIGKLDLHYVDDQIVGTLLIWQEYATGFARTHASGSDESIDGLIDQILTEASEPLGVPGEYGVEVYYPSVQNHYFVSNYENEGEGDEEEGAEGAGEWENAKAVVYTPEEDGEEASEKSKDGDEFGKYLRSKP